MELDLDKELLQKLEDSLDTSHIEKGEVPINVLGYGEISIVFEILGDKTPDIAYKRLPIFDSEEQVQRHIEAYNEYNRLLKEDVGIDVPAYGAEWVYTGKKKKKNRKITLFCAQKKVPPPSIGNNVIHDVSDPDIKKLVYLVMKELKKIWDFNRKNDKIQVGFDGQISNWTLVDYKEDAPSVSETTRLQYIDTSTPLYRVNGEEAMEPTLFLKSAPPGLRYIVKKLFLQEVLDRYHDWRKVTTDLLANFYKEQLPDVIPSLVEVVNEFFATEANEFEIEPLTVEGIKKYYKGDKRIWVVFQTLRRFHRFIRTKILRRKYEFYLPGKIER